MKTEPTALQIAQLKDLMRRDREHHATERYVKRSNGRKDLIHAGKPKAKAMRRRLALFMRAKFGPRWRGVVD